MKKIWNPGKFIISKNLLFQIRYWLSLRNLPLPAGVQCMSEISPKNNHNVCLLSLFLVNVCQNALRHIGRNVLKHTTNGNPKTAWNEGSYSTWWQARRISKQKKLPLQHETCKKLRKLSSIMASTMSQHLQCTLHIKKSDRKVIPQPYMNPTWDWISKLVFLAVIKLC